MYESLVKGWCSNEVRSVYGVGLWKNIKNGWEDFARFINFKVGDGARLSFWHDLWCGYSALKTMFPYLYGLAHNQDVCDWEIGAISDL